MGLLVDATYCSILLFVFCDCSHKSTLTVKQKQNRWIGFPSLCLSLCTRSIVWFVFLVGCWMCVNMATQTSSKPTSTSIESQSFFCVCSFIFPAFYLFVLTQFQFVWYIYMYKCRYSHRHLNTWKTKNRSFKTVQQRTKLTHRKYINRNVRDGKRQRQRQKRRMWEEKKVLVTNKSQLTACCTHSISWANFTQPITF